MVRVATPVGGTRQALLDTLGVRDPTFALRTVLDWSARESIASPIFWEVQRASPQNRIGKHLVKVGQRSWFLSLGPSCNFLRFPTSFPLENHITIVSAQIWGRLGLLGGLGLLEVGFWSRNDSDCSDCKNWLSKPNYCNNWVSKVNFWVWGNPSQSEQTESTPNTRL